MQARRPEDAPSDPSTKTWPHAERSIWTNRMLAVLETGQRSHRWYSLADKAFSLRSLERAADQVCANGGSSGIDGMTIARFQRARHRILPVLHGRLMQGTYTHRPVRRVWIPKPGKRSEKRPLGIPTIVDRVVQTAARNAMEPIFDSQFHDHSYGFRPGRRAQDAMAHLTKALRSGYTWVIDADLKSFFDTIDHDLLMNLVRDKIVDKRLLGTLWQMLKAGVMEATEDQQPVCHSNDEGTPQGGVISPLLANIFLNELDHQINREDAIMIRYADDFVICCRTEAQAQTVLAAVQHWTTQRRLTLHPEKTTVVDMSIKGHTIEFLGWRIKRWETGKDDKARKPRYLRTIRKKSTGTFRTRLRLLTKRNNGTCLPTIVQRINPIIRGFGAYFRSAEESDLIALDKWVRLRLRSILRRRLKRKGRGRGRDHHRWPNSFFAKSGLISLKSVRAEWSQSLQG